MKGKPDDFWAKLDKDDDGNIIQWHPLIAHSADVAAVFEALLKCTILNRRLARLMHQQTLTDIQIARLSAMAALHDAGKANHGFQNKEYDNLKPKEGHQSPIISVLKSEVSWQEELLVPLGIHKMIQWFTDDQTAVQFLVATWAHHGRPLAIQHDFKPGLWRNNETRTPIDGLKDLGSSVEQWFPKAYEVNSQTFPDDPVIQHVYNGILTLADWLGSDTRFFGYVDSMENYMDSARNKALEAVRALSLEADIPRKLIGNTPVSFRMISPWEPFEIQSRCLELPSHSEGSLTILESDTGSGKTEAALIRFMKLYQQGLVDGMYFAVPTRSAATQLYSRVVKAIEQAFNNHEDKPPVIQAVSGYIKVDEIEGQALPHFRVLWPDDQKDQVRERSWAAEHSKRYLAGAVVIGTIDQVLLSALQVKHVHLRSASLLRHFLVVDEVHASDVYMTKLLERVLDFHLSAGGHAFLMSATLGTASRYRFAEQKDKPIPDAATAEQIAYPLLTHTDDKQKNTEEVTGNSSGFHKKVKPEVLKAGSDHEEIAKLAYRKATEGARVLIIRNKIKDCIETQKAIEDQVGDNTDLLFKTDNIPVPHHSRFATEDRKKLDAEIESYFGKTTSFDSIIAVATQTVEQSLDIDADYLITDLCPMDVLLQRVGRLHRHKRSRPSGFETAKCTVITPEERDLGTIINRDGQVWKGKLGLGTVYQDLRILEATWRVLESEDLSEWNIPEDNRKLVERSMHPAILESLVNEQDGAWEAHQQHIEGQEFADMQLPQLVGIDFTKPFEESGFNEDLKSVKTRLGRDDIHLKFEQPVEGPFGNHISEITVADWMLGEVPEATEIPSENMNPAEGGFQFQIADHKFKYDRLGLSLISK